MASPSLAASRLGWHLPWIVETCAANENEGQDFCVTSSWQHLLLWTVHVPLVDRPVVHPAPSLAAAVVILMLPLERNT
jgi:hypothetical protein